MKPEDSRDLRKNSKRLMWFLLCIFLFDAVIVFTLINYAGLSPVLSGFIIIVITAVVYLCFWLICAKIDKKNKIKQEKESYKDPFTKKQFDFVETLGTCELYDVVNVLDKFNDGSDLPCSVDDLTFRCKELLGLADDDDDWLEE